MRTLIAIVLLATAAFGQQQQQRVVAEQERRGPEEPPKYEPSAAEKKLGAQVLEEAVAQARGLEDDAARAHLLVEAAKAYDLVDKEMASELLVEAFQATVADDNDDTYAQSAKRNLQSTIFQRLISRGYNVESLMASAEPEVRSNAASMLITRALAQRDLERAYELLAQIDPESRYPYGAVEEMMRLLPPERAGEQLTLFAQAVTHFRNEKPERGVRVGDDGLVFILMRHWKKLPQRSVLEAVDLLLARAKEKDERTNGGPQLSVATAKGAAQFNGHYEYELFRLLPILRELDHGKAERLLAQQRSLEPVLDKYPEGMASLNPWYGDPEAAPDDAGMTMSVRGRGPSGGPVAPDPAMLSQAELNRRAMEIARDAEKNPKQALAAAMSLPEEGRMGSPRVMALQGIVSRTWKTAPSIAREALREIEAAIPRLSSMQKTSAQRDVVRTYLKMEDHEAAKKAIEAGMKLAKEEYEKESDDSDPNLAIKPKWQSTNVWRTLLAAAAEISPQTALELLKEVPDKEIQLAQRIALAAMWVGAGAPGTSVEVRRKSGMQLSYTED